MNNKHESQWNLYPKVERKIEWEKKLKNHLALHYRGNNPRIELAVIGGAISNSSIINSVSSSHVNDDDDFVGDYRKF